MRFGVDENALQTLFSLAQYSEEGRRQANMVVSKLLKKEADNEVLNNPSAFVHASCQRARKDLHPWVEARDGGRWTRGKRIDHRPAHEEYMVREHAKRRRR